MTDKALYGITALRFAGPQMVGAMMGLIDTTRARWDLRPAPLRIVEVVDRLVEGDTVISIFSDGEGGFAAGPEVKVEMRSEGSEELALDEEAQGRTLCDLPRF